MLQAIASRSTFLLLLVCFVSSAQADDAKAEDSKANSKAADAKPAVNILTTSDGTRFGILGEKPAAPAATLFVFADDIKGTLTNPDFNAAGQTLAADGVLCVSIDLPCHGQDVRDGEPAGIDGWRHRLEKGERIIETFVMEASEVLDYLVAEKFTDPTRVAAMGTSRGGFAAMHFAAVDKRIAAVASFAPLTNLLLIREFDGSEPNSLAGEFSLVRYAEKLAGRPLWIIIGNNDARVSTDESIRLVQAISGIAAKRQLLSMFRDRTAKKAPPEPLPHELHIVSSVGHGLPPDAHALVAKWLAAQKPFQSGKPKAESGN